MKTIKYSDKFKRDYKWYLAHRHIFNFDGNIDYTTKRGDKVIKKDSKGKSAKECFYIFDSQGKVLSCRQSKLLYSILKCKGSINFNIKMWAEDRANLLLPRIEFDEIIKEFNLLDWIG